MKTMPSWSLGGSCFYSHKKSVGVGIVKKQSLLFKKKRKAVKCLYVDTVKPSLAQLRGQSHLKKTKQCAPSQSIISAFR